MEIFIFILLLIILIYMLTMSNGLQDKLKTISFQMELLRSELKEIKKKSLTQSSAEATLEKPGPVLGTLQEAAPVITAEVPLPVPVVEVHEEIPGTIQVDTKQVEEPVISYAAENEPAPPIITKPKKPSFFESHPDLEKFIGENLINKIGIAILVLGIGFFVKFAIDQEWINEIGRVFIGILAGGILLGVAHRMRKTFQAFSSVLVGGGIAVFYFTIAIAFHEYHIFSQTAAFVLMVCITGFAILLSITYNRIELAVIALIGGFVSPFILSTGEGNYVVLFTYILLLDIGMLVLAYFKKWNLINIISYFFTVIIFTGWTTTKLQIQKPYLGALIFATCFYLVFFLMNIINNLKEKRKFLWPEISILLSNTFFYYSAGMYILYFVKGAAYQGLFTVLVGVFNFLFAFSLFRSGKADRNLVYLLIGLVLTFVSLAAPVQLKGNYITMFWALEAVLLLWLSQKSGIKMMEVASLAVSVLMCISLVLDWMNIYATPDPLTIIFNKAGITTLLVLLSICASILLLRKSNETFAYLLPPALLVKVAAVLLVTVAYIGALLELGHQLTTRVEPVTMQVVVLGSYNLAFLFCLQLLLLRLQSQLPRVLSVAASFFVVLAFLFYYHGEVVALRYDYLEYHTASLAQFLFHLVLYALVLLLLFSSLQITTQYFGKKSMQQRIYFWYLVFVFVLSAELDHLVALLWYGKIDAPYLLSQNHRIGYPILWGIISFTLMVVGMKKKIKDLRIISLSLFLILLLKLFVVDLRDISEGGKIAAFISLGLLLLIISFMYQKLKRLVLEEEVKI